MSVELITVCPFCNEQHEVATGVIGMRHVSPENGDISLCFKCGEWAIFNLVSLGLLRKPTKEEYEEIGMSKELQELRKAWVEVRIEPI